MNYQTEIRMFNEWLETHELTASGIALWYALMFMAYRSDWPTEITIPVSALCLRSKLSRSAVYKERNMLRDYGLLDFDTTSGRRSTCYRIRSFEGHFMATEMSTTRTQTGDERIKAGGTSTTWTQPCTQTEDSTYISIKNKYRDKRGYGGKKSAATQHQDTFDLTFIADPRWLELVKTWLDYKQSRGEKYKSELSIKKFHTMLRNLSRGDPDLAAQIIDKSIANNWAGIFELTERTSPSVSGQRIGQIKQPADEERRRRLLENFGRMEVTHEEPKNR